MAILVNGNGNARVYAAQDADLIASITGNQTVRTSVGNKMAATAADASTISVADGVILTKEGRRIQLDAGQTDLFTIPTGSAGVTNYYIIGYKLTTNSDNVQVAETFVQLMASSTDTIPEGTFRGGDSEVYVSVARVEQDGVNLGTITALLPELETISELNNDLTAEDDLVFKFSKSGSDYGYKDSNDTFKPFGADVIDYSSAWENVVSTSSYTVKSVIIDKLLIVSFNVTFTSSQSGINMIKAPLPTGFTSCSGYGTATGNTNNASPTSVYISNSVNNGDILISMAGSQVSCKTCIGVFIGILS